MALYKLPICRTCRYPLKGLRAIAGERAEAVESDGDQRRSTRDVRCPECGTVQAMVGLRPLPSLAQSAAWCSAVPLACVLLALPAAAMGIAIEISFFLCVGTLLACAVCPVIAVAVFEERYRLHPDRKRVLLGMLLCNWMGNLLMLVLWYVLLARLIL